MCELNGGLASWRVNGIYYNSLPSEIRDDLDTYQEDSDDGAGNEILTLTIPGKAKYNGTKVQCVTGEFGSDPIESENATFKIQGSHNTHNTFAAEFNISQTIIRPRGIVYLL